MAESTVNFFQGVRGSGKTNAAMGELYDVSPLFAIAIRSNDWKWMPQSFHSYTDFVYWSVSRPINKREKMQVRFEFSKKEDYISLFQTMAESFRNSTIVVDEADALYSVQKFNEPLDNLFLGSSNNNLNLYYMSKRPFLVPVLIRSNVERFVIFRTEEKRDVDYLAARTRQQFPADPFNLKVGQAIVFCPRLGEVPKLHQFPKFTEHSTTTRVEGQPTSSKKLITLKA